MTQDNKPGQRQGNKENFDRKPQTERGKEGSKGSAQIEREEKPVGDTDIDREVDDSDDEAITQRNPRIRERGAE
jgi:hypothetical protein